MRLLLFSDLHGDIGALERLLSTDADAYFSLGDLVSWARGYESLAPVFARFRRTVYIIPGNHESETDIARFAAECGLIALHGRTAELDGVTLAALGYSNRTPFNTPGEYSEDELARRLELLGRPQVLVCHCPPKNTALDDARTGHFGSTAIRSFIEQTQPARFFCGHIHEAEGREDRLGATLGVNVGRKGYLLDTAALQTGETNPK
jgi:hypothetical protein